MSVLEEYGLYIGCTFLLRWTADDSHSALVPVILQKAELLESLSPSQLRLTVLRKHPNGTGNDTVQLKILSNNKERVPSVSFFVSGMKDTWTPNSPSLEQGQ